MVHFNMDQAADRGGSGSVRPRRGGGGLFKKMLEPKGAFRGGLGGRGESGGTAKFKSSVGVADAPVTVLGPM